METTMIKPEHTIFVGRGKELQELMEIARQAFAGQAGVVFVTGEAGIGKTYLAEEFFERLRKEYKSVVIASGQCTIQSASYLPFHAILEDLLESQRKVTVSGKKLRQVAEVVVDTIWNVGPDLIGVFGIPIKVLQTVADKLGLRGKKSATALEIPKDLDQVKIFGWYTKVMKDIAAQVPLVLFLDDLHWADDSSLNLLLHLGRELDDQRLLVIGSYRPHEVTSNSLLQQVKTKLGRYGAREITLDVSEEKPEEVEKTRNFVHDYLLAKYDTHFSDRFEQLLTDRTEGNALFLSEILKNLEETGQITLATPDTTQAVMPQLTAAISHLDDLPEKIENVLSERVDRLESALREILDYASVEGDDFIAQVIAKIRQIQERSLITDLTKKLMKTYQLIWERGGKSLPNGQRIHEFSFKHNLIREYVYAQLSDTDKEFIHAEIGNCLETLYAPNTDKIAAQLAIHFSRAHRLDKAVAYCLKAAQDANIRYGTSEAVRFGKMGLEALEERKTELSQEEYAEQKVRLLLELAKAEGHGGDPKEEIDHVQAGIGYLEANLPLLTNLPMDLCADTYAQLGKLYTGKGTQWQTAQEFLERALNLYNQSQDQYKRAYVLYQLAEIYPYLPASQTELRPIEKGIETLQKSLSLAEHLSDLSLQSRCLSLLAAKYRRTNFARAEQYATQALTVAEQLDPPNHAITIHTLNALASVCEGTTRYKTAIEHLKKSLKLARQIGDASLGSLRE